MKEAVREETERWLKGFMPLYQQAATLIHKIAKFDAEGLPTDLPTLLDGNVKLPPILKSVKELPKPKEKELRKLKKDFENVLDACIKASEWGVKFSQDQSRIRLSMIVFQTTAAIEFMKSFSKRLTLLSKE